MGYSPPQASDISAGVVGAGCLCSRSFFMAGEYANSFGRHSLSLWSGRHVSWLCSKIKVMSPSGAQVKQVCLQPVLNDLGVLNLEFFKSDANPLCAHHPRGSLQVTSMGTKENQFEHVAPWVRKPFVILSAPGIVFLEAKDCLRTKSAPYILRCFFFFLMVPS